MLCLFFVFRYGTEPGHATDLKERAVSCYLQCDILYGIVKNKEAINIGHLYICFEMK